ncbi:MAG: hypothetical protein HQM01_10490 [Magnetococcales bacterium]|nr:hypothetical protein [Magnetococcales bacterium]
MATWSPAALEAEWTGNLTRRKRRSIAELSAIPLREIALGPDESFYALLGLKPLQWLKRQRLARYHAALLAFVWRQAVLSTHPAYNEPFGTMLERLFGELPGVKRERLERYINDLNFFKVITDTFEEDGFMSPALHVTQRVLGEINKQPENLEWAVDLSLWLDERFQAYRGELLVVEMGGVG